MTSLAFHNLSKSIFLVLSIFLTVGCTKNLGQQEHASMQNPTGITHTFDCYGDEEIEIFRVLTNKPTTNWTENQYLTKLNGLNIIGTNNSNTSPLLVKMIIWDDAEVCVSSVSGVTNYINDMGAFISLLERSEWTAGTMGNRTVNYLYSVEITIKDGKFTKIEF